MGSKYDKYGSLKNWWTKADKEKFDKRAGLIVKQFDQYTMLDTVHLNGKLEEIENIADLGGLAIAYTAFQKKHEAQKDTLIDGLAPDQRFFMATAQVGRSKLRPQTLAWLINSNGHAPGKYRVNGPMSNMPAFYKVWHVKPGDKMYRPDSVRVKIW
jgi:putative endopeptidase